MTAFEALLDSLPSGLHDAEMMALRIDYARAEVMVDLLVDISTPDDGGPDPNDRPARITFRGVTGVVVDGPGDDGETFGPSMIDAGSGHPGTDPHPGVAAPDGGFLCWIYLARWNGFIRIGARRVSLDWTDAMPVTADQPLVR